MEKGGVEYVEEVQVEEGEVERRALVYSPEPLSLHSAVCHTHTTVELGLKTRDIPYNFSLGQCP